MRAGRGATPTLGRVARSPSSWACRYPKMSDTYGMLVITTTKGIQMATLTAVMIGILFLLLPLAWIDSPIDDDE